MKDINSHKKFRKSPADPGRFPPIPASFDARLGGVMNDPEAVLGLSWLRGGARLGSPSEVEVGSGRIIRIEKGQAWGSVESIVEDVAAATGLVMDYQKAYRGIKRASKLGLIREVATLGGGFYGKIYDVSRMIRLGRTEKMVDVMSQQKVLLDLDPTAFRYSEIVEGAANFRKIREFGDGLEWVRDVAINGRDKDALTTIGFWRAGEGGERTAPVYVPWIYLDIDRDDIQKALSDVRRLLFNLEEKGFDLSRVHVSFSGRRGFHVAIESGQFGSPVFVDSNAARFVIGNFIDRIRGDVVVDTCTFTPLALIRITGATHPKTGNKKTTWPGDYFLFAEDEVDAAINGERPFTPYSYEDPVRGSADFAVADLFIRSAVAASAAIERNEEAAKLTAATAKKRKKKVPKAVQRALLGVAEGERFAPTQSGRDKAAFIIAAYYLEIGVAPKKVLDFLVRWNMRNKPPMPEDILPAKVNSAISTLYSKGKLAELTFV